MKKKLLVGLGIAALVAFGALVWRLDLPHWKKLDLRRIEQMSSSTTVYDENDAVVGALRGSEHRIWVELSTVPEHVQQAFIAAEDLRFYKHHGVDFHRLAGALWQDIRTLSYAQGGSTITQQLIKLTHLSQVKTLSRKAQEIVLALQLERVMDKRHILEAYLNAVYFGHGAYGIEAAANVYFDKSAKQLTLSEGALLAGVIKSPSTYAPHLNPDKATSRRNSILQTMEKNGMITESQRRKAQAEAVHLAVDEGEAAKFAWYMDTVLDEASAILNISADELMTGRYGIHTAFNPGMQAEAEALFDDATRFPADGQDGTPVQAALVALNAENGELQAVIGGRRYDVMRGLNRATDMRRQPGSAFKPVSTYAAAIDAYGYLPSSIIDDTPRVFPGGYVPGNAGGATYGPVTLREALSRSLNVATVDLADNIGVPALRAYANRFGLSPDAADANLSLALGAMTYGVSPAQLGGAYCALANGGTRVTPHTVRMIEDGDGRVLYRAPVSESRAVTPETAYMITDMLKTAATKGSAKALAACGFPVAGKTGTVAEGSNGTRDIWTAAYTPDTAVCVWMGFDDPGTGNRLPASARRFWVVCRDPRSTGISSAPAASRRPWWTALPCPATGSRCSAPSAPLRSIPGSSSSTRTICRINFPPTGPPPPRPRISGCSPARARSRCWPLRPRIQTSSTCSPVQWTARAPKWPCYRVKPGRRFALPTRNATCPGAPATPCCPETGRSMNGASCSPVRSAKPWPTSRAGC